MPLYIVKYPPQLHWLTRPLPQKITTFFVSIFNIYALGNFHVYDTVLLTIIVMLYIRLPELIQLITGTLYSFNNISLLPPLLRPWQLPFFLLGMSLTFLDSTCKCYHTVFVCLCLTYFT